MARTHTHTLGNIPIIQTERLLLDSRLTTEIHIKLSVARLRRITHTCTHSSTHTIARTRTAPISYHTLTHEHRERYRKKKIAGNATYPHTY